MHTCSHMHDNQQTKFSLKMSCKVTHCAGCNTANTRPHQLRWGDACIHIHTHTHTHTHIHTHTHTSPGCKVHSIGCCSMGRCGRVKVTQLRVVTSGWNVGRSSGGYRNQRWGRQQEINIKLFGRLALKLFCLQYYIFLPNWSCLVNSYRVACIT